MGASSNTEMPTSSHAIVWSAALPGPAAARDGRRKDARRDENDERRRDQAPHGDAGAGGVCGAGHVVLLVGVTRDEPRQRPSIGFSFDEIGIPYHEIAA